MALPTDPIKLAQLRARNAANARAYRARKRAEAAGLPIPEAAAYKRPPKVSRSALPKPGAINPAEKAAEAANAKAKRRLAFIATLPDARNPLGRLRVPDLKLSGVPSRLTIKGQLDAAKRIREREAAREITALGRKHQNRLRSELEINGRIYENLGTDENRARFIALNRRIAKHSQQTLGILFEFSGGDNDYFMVKDLIEGSPTSRDIEEAFDRLEALADTADTAGTLYSPKALKKRLGGTGRIRF